MKPFFRLAQLMIVVSLFFVSCTPTVVPPGPVATDTPTSTPTPSPTPSPTHTQVPLPPHPINIAIDESTSVNAGCDTNYYRYTVPLFLLNVVKSLGDKFKPLDDSPTHNLMLAEDAGANPPIRLVSGDQTIDEIKGRIEKKRSFENHPFIPVLNTYKNNLSQSPESTLLFFTDGDFTGLSSVNPKTLADDVMRQFRDIHTEFPNAKMYVFLLCAGRFKNALPDNDYPVIKQTWDDISAYKYATVYGLGQDKMIPNDSETGVFLKQLLDTVFRDQGLPENSDPSPESSWGWGFLNQGPDRFLYVYPPTVRLKLDLVSFDENATHPFVLLDGQVLDRSFVPPAKECGLHELRITNPPPLTFYWWQADVPQFSLEILSWQPNVPGFPLFTSSPIVFYNGFSSSINAKIVLKSLWDGSILPTTNSLLNYSKCMTFQARVNGGEWVDKDPSGKFILANPLPDRPNALTDVGYRSIWDGEIETDSHFSSAQVRYFPEYKSRRIDSSSFDSASNVRFVLTFNFLSDNYYPPDGNYQPNSGFTDTGCPRSPGGPPIRYGFNWDLDSFRREATVELFPNNQVQVEEWKKCTHFEINWTSSLPIKEGWIDPDKIRVTCELHWSNNDTAGVILDSIECQQGEK